MTGRTGSSIDRTPLSAADEARLRAEQELHETWARSAVRVVAASSADAADCRQLLAILGLDGDALRSARPARHWSTA